VALKQADAGNLRQMNFFLEEEVALKQADAGNLRQRYLFLEEEVALKQADAGNLRQKTFIILKQEIQVAIFKNFHLMKPFQQVVKEVIYNYQQCTFKYALPINFFIKKAPLD
jgi:hypothetical protein